MEFKNFVYNTYKKTDKIILEVIKKPFIFKLNKIEDTSHVIDKVGNKMIVLKIIFTILLSGGFVIISNSHYFSIKYISNILEVIDWSTDIFITLFGVVLTVFSITIALWSNMAIKKLAESNSSGNANFSMLEGLLISYMSIMVWSVLLILINFVIKVILLPLPNDWVVPYISFQLSELIASILLFLYMFIVFCVVFDIFSLLLNLYTSTVAILYINAKEDEKNNE